MLIVVMVSFVMLSTTMIYVILPCRVSLCYGISLRVSEIFVAWLIVMLSVIKLSVVMLSVNMIHVESKYAEHHMVPI